MSSSIINFRTDKKTKSELIILAKELGVPISTIINAQIKQILRERKITLSASLEPTDYLIKIMEEIEGEIATKQLSTNTLTDSEAKAHLDAL